MKKSKKITRKIISVILSVLMIASSFTGVLTVFAKSTDDFHDENLAANFMAWAETTDEQTAEALLDYLDDVLQKANLAPIAFSLNAVVVNVNIKGYLDSVDGILDLARQVFDLLNQYGNLVGGDVSKLKIDPLVRLGYTTEGSEVFSKCNKSYRSQNDAKAIIMAIAETLYWNSNDNTSLSRSNQNVLGQFIKGNLNLGVASSAVDVYSLIGNALGMWSGYQSNLVYNVVANIILTKTGWYTDQEIKEFQAGLGKTGDNVTAKKWNFDEQLFEKLSNELMNKISVNMTYALEKQVAEDGTVTFAPTDSSESRYKKMTEWLDGQGLEINDENLVKASQQFNYDTGLRYDSNGHVYIFKYNNDTLNVTTDIKTYDLVDQALKLAWKTVLRPTLSTLRVNDDMDWYEGHGGNFDNKYFEWLISTSYYDADNWENNYTMEKVKAFANSENSKTGEKLYEEYGYKTADAFIEHMKEALTYDREVVDDPQYNWRDVDEANGYTTETGSKENILFGKLRYSPLADKVFNIQTGPINLYIMETGAPNFVAFMNSYVEDNCGGKYANLIAGLNDGLVAAVKDIFPQSNNIAISDGKGGLTPLTYPTLEQTNGTMDVSTIAKTLVKNFCAMFEYGANAADENILNGFYHNNNITDKVNPTHLSEENLEEALVPLLVSCITVVAATRSIHTEDWDKAVDAEGVAFVALREYLSYSLPSKDYDQFVTTENGYYEAKDNVIDIDENGKKNLYDVVLIMCRDAVGYLLNSVVPCRDENNDVWDIYESDPATDTTTLFDILNSVICYYASTDTYTDPASGKTTTGKGCAALIGVVDSNGKCLVTNDNDLWTNIDIIGNTVWPTLGIFQTGENSNAGNLDSKKFVYNDIVESLLNIADVHDGGERGITTIVKQLLTCFTAEPIVGSNALSVSQFVYDDVLASLVNGVFGAKLNGQLYKHVIPTLSEMTEEERKTPFDSLVQAKYIAKWNGGSSGNNSETGILGILISLLYGNFGGTTEVQNDVRGKGSWTGAMFIVQSVSYFIDGFLPQLGEQQFNAATVSTTDPVRVVEPGADMDDLSVTIKNNSVGLNRFYKQNGKVIADDRYFIQVTSLTTSVSGTAVNFSLSNNPKDQWIEPEGSYKVNLNGSYPLTGESVITFNLTYDVYRGTKTGAKTLAYSNQSSSGSVYISTSKSWYNALSGLETKKVGDTEITHKYATSGNVNSNGVGRYTDVVFTTSDIDNVNTLGLPGGTTFARYYAYAPETDNDDAEYDYTYVATDSNGNIVSLDRYDYTAYPSTGTVVGTGEEVELDNGMTVTTGYTNTELNEKLSAYLKSGSTKEYNCNIDISNHVVFTRAQVEEMLAEGDKYIYQDYATGNGYNYAVASTELVEKNLATATTPVKGITFVGDQDGFTNPQWLRHVANSSVAAGETELELWGVQSNGRTVRIGTTNLIITDDTKARNLQNTFTNYQNEMSSYQPSDYNDYDKSDNTSATSKKLTDNFVSTLMGIGAPVSLRNARELVSTMALAVKTSKITASTGDVAYAPAKTVTGALEGKTYTKGGYQYIDEDCTIPVYTNVALKDSDVKNGKNALGQAVTKIGDTYYYVNDKAYVYGWDTTTSSTFSEFPYYGKTDVEDTYLDSDKVVHNYYDKTLHSYYTEDGKSANESDAWDYSYAVTETVIKPYTVESDGSVTDYRGTYDKYSDALRYAVEQAKSQVNTDLITEVTDGIIKDRAGKDPVNYDVSTYEKMVQVAKNGEKLVTATGVDETTGETTYTTTAPSVELREAKKLYDKYKGFVVARDYEGAKLEKEIAENLGTTKSNITVDGVTKDKDGNNVYTNAKIIVKNGTAEYGSINSANELVNEINGVKAYTDESWNAYYLALAEAVVVAQEAKSENIAGTYDAKKNTVIAENALVASSSASQITFEGTITEAVDGTGKAGTVGLDGVEIYANGTKVGTTKADGTFSVALPKSFTDNGAIADVTVEIKGANVITRTFTVNDDTSNANVGVVAIDFNGDNKIDATDAALLAKNGSKLVSNAEFTSILKSGVNYSNTID